MKFPNWNKTKRHFFPEKVESGTWFRLCPYTGAFTGRRLYIKDDKIKWDVCLSKTLKVGDIIPTGMVLLEEMR